MPNSCANANPNSNSDFIPPSELLVPQNELNGDMHDADIHPSGVSNNKNAENDLALEKNEK